MRRRLFFRNLGVSAPRVTVRSQMSPAVRALLLFVAMAVAAALGVAIYEYGRNYAGPDRHDLQAEVERLRADLRTTEADRDRLAAVAAAGEAQLKVERAAEDQLLEQVKVQERESTKLKEDLDFFDSLLPAGAGNKDIVIRSFRVQPGDDAGQLRYRLLVQQSGHPERDFVGSVQLFVNFTQTGHSFVLQMPEPGAAADRLQQFALGFRYYQHLEGTFTLPAGAAAKSVKVVVTAGGQTRMQQNFTL